MTLIQRYVSVYRTMRSIDALDELLDSYGLQSENGLRQTRLLKEAIRARYPHVMWYRTWKATFILLPAMYRAYRIWGMEDLNMEWIRERYPSEWKRAASVCPDFDVVANQEAGE